MGWGIYDDQNDGVTDIWICIEESILPKCYFSLVKNIKDDTELYQFRRLYGKSNPKLLYGAIEKWISRQKKKTSLDDRDDYFHSQISGIGMKAVKIIESTPGYDPLVIGSIKSNRYNNILPDALPRGFPDTIRISVVESIKELIKNLKTNTQGWDNYLRERYEVLQHELYLFTRGNQGKLGKQNKTIHTKEKQKSKQKSKRINLIHSRTILKQESKQRFKQKSKQRFKQKSKRRSKRKSKQRSKRKLKQKSKQRSKQKSKRRSKQKSKRNRRSDGIRRSGKISMQLLPR
jgi:hypothetical protein